MSNGYVVVKIIDVLTTRWVAMDKQIKIRLSWVELNEATGDAGLTCRPCGISRPTL